MSSLDDSLSDVFMLQARICKRCGRILTSKKSIEIGYGCQCAKKEKQKTEEMAPIPGQIDIYDWMEEWE